MTPTMAPSKEVKSFDAFKVLKGCLGEPGVDCNKVKFQTQRHEWGIGTKKGMHFLERVHSFIPNSEGAGTSTSRSEPVYFFCSDSTY
jgi:hypothetical protein